MNKPQVRIVSGQSEEYNPIEVSGSEAEMLLYKYGYNPNGLNTQSNNVIPHNPNSDLTFEEMVRMEEEKKKRDMESNWMKQNGPKPKTFGGDYYNNINYADIDGVFSAKIEIVSNMKLPK